MSTYVFRLRLIYEFLFAVGLLVLIVPCSFAETEDILTDPAPAASRQSWRVEPEGRTWIEFYAPHDSSTFMYTGSESALRLYGPSRFEFYLYVHMSTYAGYQQSANGSGPHTPVNLLHERWQEALGATWKLRVPLHLFLLRDCNHQLDKGGAGPYLWTDVAAGAGTLPPFRHFFLKEDTSRSKMRYLWFLGGGPTLRSANGSIWDFHNMITAEGWARGFVQRTLLSWLAGDFYAEANLQGATIAPKTRHRIMTEIGLTMHAGSGGWRFYYGRRWRDTTFLWPSDQRNYFGMGYVF